MPFSYTPQNFKLIQSERPDAAYLEGLKRREAAMYLIQDAGISQEVRRQAFELASREKYPQGICRWSTNIPGIPNPMEGLLEELGVSVSGLSTSLNMWMYGPGDDLPWHTDSAAEMSETSLSFRASAAICLSAGEQGDIELANTHTPFLLNERTVRMRLRLEEGQALVMPNFLMHRVLEVLSGYRVTLVETFPLFEGY